MYNPRVRCLLEDRQQSQSQVCLCKQVDLHVTVQTISCLVVNPNTQASIADQCIEPGELLCQLPSNLIRLLKVLQVALSPFDLTYVAELLERFFRVVGVFLFVREQEDLRRVMLEDVRNDTITDAR